MNIKIYIIGFVALLLVAVAVSATDITIEEMGNITDADIQDQLADNLTYHGYVVDHDDNNIYFYYSTLVIEPYYVGSEVDHFFTKFKYYKTNLPFIEVQECRLLYNDTVCWSNLVENWNEYDTGRDDPETSEDIYFTPVWKQLKNKVNDELTHIQKLRDDYNNDDVKALVVEEKDTTPTITW